MIETAGILERGDGAALAWRRVGGSSPTVVWLGGFRSDMTGVKAQFLADRACDRGQDFLRFDYSGHGASGGRFEDGAIGEWRGDALAILDRLTQGPLILVGSSMGAWIACLCALARPDRVAGLCLVAPAADFTERLLRPNLPADALAALQRDGVWFMPSPYEDPVPITARLLEDGAAWSILEGSDPIYAPARILQGEADTEVPWRHALALHERLAHADAIFTLVRRGDHRLSTPEDLERLDGAVQDLRGQA